jgi:threonine/homoserine/homoserine lactone efflux protein
MRNAAHRRMGRAPTLVAWILTAAFAALAAVSVAALVWLGTQIVRQDRALEVQRLQERRESAADRVWLMSDLLPALNRTVHR